MDDCPESPMTPLRRTAYALVTLFTIGVLAWIAFRFVSVELRLGPRFGIRSVAAIALPIVAGGYAFAAHRGALRRLRDLPAAVRFAASLVAGGLILASIRFFFMLYPVMGAELWIGSCLALLAFASDTVPGVALGEPPARARWPFVPHCGLATGMLLYVAVYGLPRFPG
jgi:hypothetical protein